MHILWSPFWNYCSFWIFVIFFCCCIFLRYYTFQHSFFYPFLLQHGCCVCVCVLFDACSPIHYHSAGCRLPVAAFLITRNIGDPFAAVSYVCIKPTTWIPQRNISETTMMIIYGRWWLTATFLRNHSRDISHWLWRTYFCTAYVISLFVSLVCCHVHVAVRTTAHTHTHMLVLACSTNMHVTIDEMSRQSGGNQCRSSRKKKIATFFPFWCCSSVSFWIDAYVYVSVLLFSAFFIYLKLLKDICNSECLASAAIHDAAEWMHSNLAHLWTLIFGEFGIQSFFFLLICFCFFETVVIASERQLYEWCVLDVLVFVYACA